MCACVVFTVVEESCWNIGVLMWLRPMLDGKSIMITFSPTTSRLSRTWSC